jgi:hypothetical protein
MKEKVILIILAQESLDLELRLQRYDEKNLYGPICNFWKWLGPYLELFLKTRGLLEIFVDCGMISKKGRGLSANIAGISLARNYFSTGNSVDLGGPGGVAWVHGGPRRRGQEGTAAPCRCTARGC